jgi:hypothetical protein
VVGLIVLVAVTSVVTMSIAGGKSKGAVASPKTRVPAAKAATPAPATKTPAPAPARVTPAPVTPAPVTAAPLTSAPTPAPAVAASSASQAYTALQGQWTGTGFNATVSPDPNQPGALTTNMGGRGVPGANQIMFTGVQAGSGSLEFTYDFAANPNTITVNLMGDGILQATRVTAPTSQPTVATPALQTPNGGSVRQPSTMEMGGAHDQTITGITWSNWGSTSAQGVGSETTSNCIPDCADGSPVTDQVSFTLTQPVNGVFTSMTTTDSPSTPGSQPYSMTWSYPSLWPVNAN